ncbi:MAG TPA: ATP-dependent zinc metalloprotease FtsH [Patescibacteria group bacterium]|nr:ATP-dependent zinc metalloprotease FtsH [Patescibacteria group bacterium]
MDRKLPKMPAGGQSKNLGVYLLVIALASAIFIGLGQVGKTEGTERDLSAVLTLIKEGQVEKITVSGNDVSVKLKNGETHFTKKESGESFVKTLETAGIKSDAVPLDVKDDTGGAVWLSLLFGSLLPIIVMIVIFYFLIRQARSAGDNLFAFGKSKAKLFAKDQPSAKFADVAGVDEAKGELSEVVDFLKNPGKYAALGAKIPKGVLLVGPAGVGKTLLARAVAGEAGVPFFSIAGSEFMEMLVGVGASRVRDLFENAKKSAPAIIFIDEVDSIGRQRGLGLGGGHDEREQTLNQILVEMDGFEPNSGVIVMAATNRPDMLDPALVRPGRFDRRVVLDLPDIEGRKAIMAIHSRGKPLSKNVEMERLARRTVGFSGADLENMLNEAAIIAARGGKKEITELDLESAALKVQLGPERKRLMSDEDKLMTAYHEGGHALVNYLTPSTDPVHTVSIVSRGMALGFTMMPPTTDRYNETKTRLLGTITALLGGRAAEELQFKEFTVGASNDIEKATQIARQMVTKFGMSPLGPITIGLQEEAPWVAREMGGGQGYSDALAAKVDVEVSRIIDSSFEKAKDLLTKNKKKLDLIATELIKRETLTGPEFELLLTKS